MMVSETPPGAGLGAPSAPAARRVLVAMDEGGIAADALDAAVRLASALDAHLTALFLENADLLRAAELPFFVETGAFSGMVQPMAARSMARALRAHAEQARAAVAAAAHASGLAWQFEVVRGRRLALLVKAEDALDVLVLGQVAPRDSSVAVGSGMLPRARSRGAPVAVTVRDVPSAAVALEAARAVATAGDAPLLLLLCGGTPQRIRQLRSRADRVLGSAAKDARHIALADDSPEALAAIARQQGARLLVCCDGDLRHDTERLEALRSRLTCPLAIAD